MKLAKQLNTANLLLVLPFFVVIIILKSIKWNFLLKIQGIRIPLNMVFRYYTASLFWGIITPGRIGGEAAKILYLTKLGSGAGRAALSVILDRLLDLISLLLLTGIAVSLVFHKLIWLFISLAVSGLIWLVLCKMRSKLRFSGDWHRGFSFLPERFLKAFSEFRDQFRKDIGKFSFSKVTLLSVFSVVIWLAYTFPFLLLGRRIGIEASPLFLITGIFAAAVIAILPISIGGIGTRDVFFVFYFGQLGTPVENSLLFSFMFIYMYIFNLALGFIIQPNKKQGMLIGISRNSNKERSI